MDKTQNKDELSTEDLQMHLIQIRKEGKEYFKQMGIQEANILQAKLDAIKVTGVPKIVTEVPKSIEVRDYVFQTFDDRLVKETEDRLKTLNAVKNMVYHIKKDS